MAKKEKQEKKEQKRKPQYGMLSCVKYIYKLLWQSERVLVFVGIFTVPLTLILSAFALFTPSVVLHALENANRFSYIALVILGLLLSKLLFELINNVTTVKVNNAELYIVWQLVFMLQKNKRDRDWYLDYDPEVQKKDERAFALYSNESLGVRFPMGFANMIAIILNFILFGSVISLLHPLIIVLLAMGYMINFLFEKWERRKNWEDRDIRGAIKKKMDYFNEELSRNPQYAKDVRLYGMKERLHERFLSLVESLIKEKERLERRGLIIALINFLIVLLRDSVAYIFLIYKALRGEVDAASFVLYFTAITSMANLMGNILGTINQIADGALQVSDLRENLEMKGKLNRGQGIPVPTGPFSIEFKNVSYKYPKGEKKVLDNVSFRIEAGEKIALVGLNGAGKTTLTMMMCGLILPDEGEVLLNGHSIYEYNREELYSLFGFVPQNYHILPISIAKNIACAISKEEIDSDRLNACIELADLSEKIASLPNGADTLLNRQINRDGVELSGGEAQKLLLARLLYKNPLCMILDEPTAALDPIAEDKMYQKYNEFSSNTTSVFISHRLASTRFCGRIFLLDGAGFAEIGTHEELMAAGGKYRELFDIQSKYYKEEA